MNFQEKLHDVEKHFLNGDTNIGFRKLTDCVLDTQLPAFYKRLISHTKWLHEQEREIAEVCDRSYALIRELETLDVQQQHKGTLLLKAENVSKNYGRGFRLDAVSMNIHSGDVWGLVGENGNGKTTLLRILAKDLSYDSGNLEYPFSANDALSYALRTKLIYVPQRTPTWYGTLRSNLKLTATHYGVEPSLNELLVQMMIIRFGLWRFRNLKWSELSSGYKMRFELARTFLRSPEILLLDEPLANLDIMAQQVILEDLKSLSQSLSNPIGIVLSSQQLFEVEKVSDKILFLREGKPTHLSDINNANSTEKTIVEFETTASRETLQTLVVQFPGSELSFNGGNYIITIPEKDQIHALMSVFARERITIKYLRDISQSTRRLFI